MKPRPANGPPAARRELYPWPRSAPPGGRPLSDGVTTDQDNFEKYPRTDSRLTYMIDIVLTTEFAVTAVGAR